MAGARTLNSRLLRVALSFSLLLSLELHSAWPAQKWLAGCGNLLRGTDWMEVYQTARAKGDVRGGAIALARLVSAEGKKWSLHPKSAAMFARAAEVLSWRTVRVSAGAPSEFSYRHRELRNLTDKATDFGRFWVKEFVWASSPFLFRPGHLYKANAQFIAFFKSSKDFLGQYSNHIAALGILVADPYFDKVIALLFTPHPEDWGDRLHVAGMGSLLRPFLISLALVTSHLHPVQIAGEMVAEPVYPLDQYFLDIAEKGGVVWEGKRIAILIDQKFLQNIPSGNRDPKGATLETNPFLGIAELQAIRAASGNLHEALVGSKEELKRELQKVGHSDIVILIAHGTAGDFILGASQERFSQAKPAKLSPVDFDSPDPVLVYISCDFGDKTLEQSPDKKELWKQMSDELFAGSSGRSFASINTISFHRTYQSGKSPNRFPATRWRIYLGATLTHASGFTWTELIARTLERATNHYGGAQGMREYRTISGVTLFHERDDRK